LDKGCPSEKIVNFLLAAADEAVGWDLWKNYKLENYRLQKWTRTSGWLWKMEYGKWKTRVAGQQVNWGFRIVRLTEASVVPMLKRETTLTKQGKFSGFNVHLWD
jgi:hypothetical protein